MKSKSAAICVVVCLISVSLGCGNADNHAPIATNRAAFQQTNLVSNTSGTAAHTDPFLLNPWGVAVLPGQSFWVANNNRASVKVFDVSGNAESPGAVTVPVPSGSTLSSKPAGVVFNPIAEDFMVRGMPGQFIFATEDGTISTWAAINTNLPTTARLARDDSANGAVYKGLAIVTPQCCREYLALADFHGGFIATYDVNFNLLATSGSFKDSNLPTCYSPFNIQQVGTQVFVTYAVQDASGTNPVVAPGSGIVNVFDQEGNFVPRFVSNGPLNAPWGIVQASTNFGLFSNDILIGNFGDGTINAFDPSTGDFLGTVEDSSGKAIVNLGLWALVFRSDGRKRVLTRAVPDTPNVPLTVNEVYAALSEIRPKGAIVVEESPSNFMEFRNWWPTTEPNSYFTYASGGLGHNAPSAVGIALAQKKLGTSRPVIVLIGDGSLQCSVQSLASAAQHKLRMIYIVPCNGEYAILKEFAELEKTPNVPALDLPFLDIGALAQGYGCSATHAETKEEIQRAFTVALSADGPTVIAIPIKREIKPLIPTPTAKSKELTSNVGCAKFGLESVAEFLF